MHGIDTILTFITSEPGRAIGVGIVGFAGASFGLIVRDLYKRIEGCENRDLEFGPKIAEIHTMVSDIRNHCEKCNNGR